MCYSTSLEMAQNNYNGLNLAFFLQNYFSRYNSYVKSLDTRLIIVFKSYFCLIDEDPDDERNNHE